MALRQIRVLGDDILRKKCRPINEITPNILELIDDMIETMHKADGVGLAAPQVGILRRLAVIDVGEGPVVIINPEILETKGSAITIEGCLSVPEESGYVDRPTYAKVKALNKDGEEVIIEGRGLFAKALCHEIDHLDGILYIDKIIPEDELEFEDEE